jgi:hypothetical protein
MDQCGTHLVGPEGTDLQGQASGFPQVGGFSPDMDQCGTHLVGPEGTDLQGQASGFP